jgi:FkbM family methyltransferase
MSGLGQWLRNLRYRVFYGLLLSRRYPLETLGDQSYGVQFAICPDGLNSKSVVYSGGVGKDISFEHGLVKRFGCDIVLLDPSPTGVKTMELPENRIPQLKFSQMALAAKSGTLKMAPPVEGNFSWYASDSGPGLIEVPVTDLQSLMKKNGHDHIDLLKLDIEGCEYEVIDDLLAKRIPVRQLCADFDYGYVPGVTRKQAIRAMVKLATHGYRLIDQSGANHTFIRKP